MNEKVKLPARAIITGDVRIAFPSLFVPKPRFKGSEEKTYQCVLLLPPSTDLKPYLGAIREAMESKWGKVIQLPRAKNPIRDCSEKAGTDGYEAGWHYINLHSSRQPGVVDRLSVPVTDPNLIYAGCWVRAYINTFAWEHPSGGKGVSFGLNAIQLVRDDDRLDGRVNASAVFAPLDDVTDLGAVAPAPRPAGKVKPATADDVESLFG